MNELGVQLIAIDTSADTFGGNEIVRSQVRQFIGGLTRLAHEIDGAVLLLSHPSLTGRTTGSGESGSTAWHNSCRSRLYLEPPDAKDDEPADSDVRVLSRVKANYAKQGARITLRRERGVFVLERGGEAPGEEDRARAAERAFLAGMAELAAQNLDCNWHKGQANYAPKVLRTSTHAAATFSQEELTSAMYRLVRSKRIKSVKQGPKSRQRSFLIVIAPELPGV